MRYLPWSKPFAQSHRSIRRNSRLTLLAPLFCVFSGILSAQSGPQPLAPATLKFGTIAFESTKTLPLPIKNIGTASLTISPLISGSNYKVVDAEPADCQQGTPPSQTCTLTVEFSPAVPGVHDDNLLLDTNDGGPATVTKLKGTASGVGSEQQVLKFPTIPFGTSVVLPLPIKNQSVLGNVSLTTSINGPSYKVLKTGPQPSELPSCRLGVNEGESCE